VVFFLGVFWTRLNARGCMAALGVGFLMGLFRLAVDTPVKMAWFGRDAAGGAIGYAEGSFLWIVNNIFFQYYSILILAVSIATMVLVSLLTEKPDYRRIAGLTFGTLDPAERKQRTWAGGDVLASLAVLAAIAAAYLYFTG